MNWLIQESFASTVTVVHAIATEGPDRLVWREIPDVTPGPGEVLIEVSVAGVNRADLLQAAGRYPPPPGASDILGLEVSGVVAAVGDGCTQWKPDQQVCALLAGGGYAEHVAVPGGQVMPLPSGVGLLEAAGLPEVACTVWSNLVMTAGLKAGQTVLIHGGASGVGTHAIQVAHALGAIVAVTAGSAAKLELCRELGADLTICYPNEDFVARLTRVTGGADVILDIMGATYLDRNLDALAADGKLVVIGMQGGVKGELNIGKLLGKRATVIGTALRGRPLEGPAGKSAIVAAVVESVWPMIADGLVRPVVGATFPIQRAADAHALLAGGEVAGKIVLEVQPNDASARTN